MVDFQKAETNPILGGSDFAINPLQPRVAFHIGTSHLIYNANQITGFYMKHNIGLRWDNILEKA